MFVVGDIIEPNEGAQEHYGMTRRPTMTKGVVIKAYEGREYANIRIRITEGEELDEHGDVNHEIGTEYDVNSKHFDLATPLTADKAFEQLVHGQLNDAQYIQALKKIKNT